MVANCQNKSKQIPYLLRRQVDGKGEALASREPAITWLNSIHDAAWQPAAGRCECQVKNKVYNLGETKPNQEEGCKTESSQRDRQKAKNRSAESIREKKRGGYFEVGCRGAGAVIRGLTLVLPSTLASLSSGIRSLAH
eukprot:3033287-Pleurochrysis_carterae.AAC.1